MSSTATSDYPSLTLEWDQTAGVGTAASSWTDITAYLRSGTVTLCGRQREIDRFTGGTATFLLDNRDRRFDPLHATSPYTGNLKPLRQIRLRVTWNAVTYDIFRGYVDGWDQAYPNVGMDSVSEVRASDGFTVLGRAKLAESVWAFEAAALTDPVSGGYAGSPWYRLGEESGAIMGDSSGSALHGAYEGGATFNHRLSILPYSQDGALQFDGVGIGGVAPLFSGVGATAFAFWVTMPDEIPVAGYTTMVRLSGPLLNQITVRLNPSGYLEFATATVAPDLRSDSPMVAGRTYFVVADFLGAATALYIDGVLQSATTTTDTTWLSNVKNGIYVGGFIGAGETSWTGQLDEVLVLGGGNVPGFVIADLYAAGVAPWEGDTPGARIARLLDAVGWPASLRDLDVGLSTLGPAVLGGNALSQCQLVEQTEAGLFYIDGAGRAVFVSRSNLRSETRFVTSNGTLGDGAGEIAYSDIVTSGYDLVSIINGARVGRVGGAVQEYHDATSQVEYGEIWAADEAGLLMETDGEAADRAAWKVLRYKDPHFRVDSISIGPRASPLAAWPQALGRQIGDRVTVNRRPLNVGTAISQDCHIESVTHTFAPLEWLTTWGLSAADPNELLYMQVGSGAPRNQIGAKVGY